MSATTISGNLADSSEGPGGFAGIPEGGGNPCLRRELGRGLSLTGLTIAANQARGPGGLGGIKGGGLYFEGSARLGALTVTSATHCRKLRRPGHRRGGNVFWAGTKTRRRSATRSSAAAPGRRAPRTARRKPPLSDSISRAATSADSAPRVIWSTPTRTGASPGQRWPDGDDGARRDQPGRGSRLDLRPAGRPARHAAADRFPPRSPTRPRRAATAPTSGAFELQPASGSPLGKLQRNRKRGTATLTVTVPVPGQRQRDPAREGPRSRNGAGRRHRDDPAACRPSKKIAKALRRRGRRKVGINVTYAPAGNAAVTISRKATLVRKAHKKKRKGQTALVRRPGAGCPRPGLLATRRPRVAAADERSVIGDSVRGRPIVAISTSGEPRKGLRVLVVGCIHGDETAGMRVARRLIAAAAPPRVALWVVPTLNPDGVAAGTRGQRPRRRPQPQLPLRLASRSAAANTPARGPLSEPESRAAPGLIRGSGRT